MVKEPNETGLDKLPEEKRAQILSKKFAICFKDFDAAKNAVNEVPYYKLNEKAYNAQVDKLVSHAKGKVEEG